MRTAVFAFCFLAMLVPQTALSSDLKAAAAAYRIGDYATAVRLWKELSAHEDPAAEFHLAINVYRHGLIGKGINIEEDDTLVAKLIRKSAMKGYAPAQHWLGFMTAVGEGLPKDQRAAVKWYRLAAEQGYARSQASLAFAYLWGTGVAEDFHEGLKWMQLAAEGGWPFAQYTLGRMYMKGQDGGWNMEKDVVQAHKWLQLAALAKRDLLVPDISFADQAKEHLIELETLMTQEQISYAASLATVWWEKHQIDE